MAAPAFGAIGTELSGTNAANANVPVPSGVTTGQLIFVCLYLEANRTVTMPTGFALVSGSNQSTTTNHWSYVFWKRATGADSGTYNFTFTSTYRAAVALRVTDPLGTGDPIGTQFAKAGSTASSTTSPAVSVTTTGPDRFLLFFSTCFSFGAWTPPSGFTERLDAGREMHVATSTQAAAGSTGSVTATGGGNNQRSSWLVAVSPDAVALVDTSSLLSMF